jgi:hypothetical protein
VRPAWWISELKDAQPASLSSKRKLSSSEAMDDSMLVATPHYNLAVLEDLALSVSHNVLGKILGACPTAADTILLLKVSTYYI